MDPVFGAALVAAVPATLAALAAFYSANKNARQVTPTNGTTLAHMIEDMWNELQGAQFDIDTAEEERASIQAQLHRHDERLQDLSEEVQAHWRTGICPECESIIRIDPEDVQGTEF